MAKEEYLDREYRASVEANAFRHRTAARLQKLLTELKDRGVTVDPVTGKVTINVTGSQDES